ncbi:uncharacterized protein [Hemitrygon akajei]|uniref:uncharacterized protein n=1 Tax=Hemitrygon akajei TaxID=2704970 RepID=UPI003BFA2670
MATGGKWFWTAVKRFFPGNALMEDNQDTGSKVPKQRRIENGVPGGCTPAAEKAEQNQRRHRGIRDTDPYSGSSTSGVTVCDLGSSLKTELSNPQQGAEPESTISDLLAEGAEYRLYQLTKFYRDRLKQAIEEGVERLSWMLRQEGHFTAQEHGKVTELTEKGNQTESSRLFLSLVNGKGSRARRAMWESFVTCRTELPKLDRILREIQELDPDPQEYINIARGLSELPTQLMDNEWKSMSFHGRYRHDLSRLDFDKNGWLLIEGFIPETEGFLMATWEQFVSTKISKIQKQKTNKLKMINSDKDKRYNPTHYKILQH